MVYYKCKLGGLKNSRVLGTLVKHDGKLWTMKRRHILQHTAASIATAATIETLSLSDSHHSVEAQAKTQVRWRMATSWPTSLDILFGGVEAFCRQVAILTDRHFIITPFASGEIVPGLEVLDAVQAGTVECGHTVSHYYLDKSIALAFGTGLPFGLTAQQQNTWLYHGGGNEALNRVYADFGVISFPAGNSGAQMGGWFNQPINSLEDLQGLKMRIPGLGGEVMARLGVNVQLLPAGEIVLALEQGVIDAAEWIGPYDDLKLGFHTVAQYYYHPGWWEPGSTVDIQVNRRAWDSLPSEYQEAFKAAAENSNHQVLAQYESLNSQALQAVMQEDIQLLPYSQDILKSAFEASLDLYEEFAREDATFRQIYRDWSRFRNVAFSWNQLNYPQLYEFGLAHS